MLAQTGHKPTPQILKPRCCKHSLRYTHNHSPQYIHNYNPPPIFPCNLHPHTHNKSNLHSTSHSRKYCQSHHLMLNNHTRRPATSLHHHNNRRNRPKAPTRTTTSNILNPTSSPHNNKQPLPKHLHPFAIRTAFWLYTANPTWRPHDYSTTSTHKNPPLQQQRQVKIHPLLT